MITVGIPTLHADDDLLECVQSICEQDTPVDHIIIINNNSDRSVVDRCTDRLASFTDTYDIRITHHVAGLYKPLSVAESWNKIGRVCFDLHDMVLILNDDVVFEKDTVTRFQHAYYAQSYQPIFLPENGEWSGFVWNIPRAVCEVGWFDEAFYPAYWEDMDYAYRLRLKGYEPYCVPGLAFTHKGSQTIKKLEAGGADMESRHHLHFRRNREYYKQKWGTTEGHGGHSRPFEK